MVLLLRNLWARALMQTGGAVAETRGCERTGLLWETEKKKTLYHQIVKNALKKRNLFLTTCSTAQRECASFSWPTSLQRRIWRDADVCASPQMFQDVESEVYFARRVDIYWHVLYFISFTSSSPSLFTHTSLRRSTTFIQSSSETFADSFLSTFQWSLGPPDETFLPKFFGFDLHFFHLPKSPQKTFGEVKWKEWRANFVSSFCSFEVSGLSAQKYHPVQICTKVLCNTLLVTSWGFWCRIFTSCSVTI